MNYLWIFLCLIAMVLAGIHPLIYKILTKNIKDLPIVLAFIFLFAGIISLLYLTFNYKSIINYTKNNFTNFKYIIALSLIILIFNFCVSYAVQFSPNICICVLILNLSVFVTIAIEYLFFKHKFNIQTIFGFILAVIGLTIAILFSSKK